MDKFGRFVLWLLIMIGGITFSGYALTIMWGWFLVPAFNFPTITVPVAIGITTIVGVMAKHVPKTEEEGGDPFGDLSKVFFMAIGKPAFVLLFGWIVTKFM